ncbi:hypothetical protein F7R21_26940 [Burkholderia latens]|uniref:Uncharacterized protein n=1 Tax=Burkholderia latens TaxID=488446 RepID=A0A6H9SIQ7_9BURK|nr:hypothetical protein F7R21_26940 [Burkholderia latens]
MSRGARAPLTACGTQEPAFGPVFSWAARFAFLMDVYGFRCGAARRGSTAAEPSRSSLVGGMRRPSPARPNVASG